MDLKLVEYIVEIAKENNITRAAEKLFITQSALNQQLLKLERGLGTPLFHRSRTDWRPTEAGEVYLQAAGEMLRLKRDAYERIFDIAKLNRGKLSVGFTPGRGIPMFTQVYRRFHALHPNIQVIPKELGGYRQLDMIAHDELDLGFVTLREDDRKKGLTYLPLCAEDILLIVPPDHPTAAGLAGREPAVADMDRLREDNFVLINRESSLRRIVDEVFEDAGFRPNVLFETANITAIVNSVESGLCCGIVPRFYARELEGRAACFYLPDYPTWEVLACYKANTYLSEAARSFVNLALDYWTGMGAGDV